MSRPVLRLAFACTLTLSGLTWVATPAQAQYCNTDPCATFDHFVCTMCRYHDETPEKSCQYTIVYCVDCHTGELLHWDSNEDFCLWKPQAL
jgi:hypothetical protein